MNREDIINFISAHKTEFEQKFGVKKIGLFGSYARGKAYEGSDIDIVVELEKPDLFCLIVSSKKNFYIFSKNIYLRIR